MSDPLDIPEDVVEAAEKVSTYMKQNLIRELCGLSKPDKERIKDNVFNDEDYRYIGRTMANAYRYALKRLTIPFVEIAPLICPFCLNYGDDHELEVESGNDIWCRVCQNAFKLILVDATSNPDSPKEETRNEEGGEEEDDARGPQAGCQEDPA